MIRPPPPLIRCLILMCASAGLSGCATPVDRTHEPGQNDPAAADSQTSNPSMVLTDVGVAGKTETGEKVHCRRKNKPGSRMMETVCMTESQRRQAQEHAESILKGTGRRTLESRTAR